MSARHRWVAVAVAAALSAVVIRHRRAEAAVSRGDSAAASPAVAVLAGGCYWGVESVYRHVRGVQAVVSGYATPVGSADHAESVRIIYHPSQISYHRILEIFFSVAHDPTQLDRQGPDVGREYRSIVFADAAQRPIARAFMDSLTAAHAYRGAIVTELDALARFEPVDESQQNFAEKHPDLPYIRINDAPKLVALQRRFAALYRR